MSVFGWEDFERKRGRGERGGERREGEKGDRGGEGERGEREKHDKIEEKLFYFPYSESKILRVVSLLYCFSELYFHHCSLLVADLAGRLKCF